MVTIRRFPLRELQKDVTGDNVKKQQLQLYGGPGLANPIERKTTKTDFKELATLTKPASNSTNATTEFRRLTQFVGEQFSSFTSKFKRRYIEAQHINKTKTSSNQHTARHHGYRPYARCRRLTARSASRSMEAQLTAPSSERDTLRAVVPPVALRPKLFELAQHGHQGTIKTLALLQRHDW